MKMVDFEELVEKLAAEREKYIGIINEIERGKTRAVNQLDPSLFNWHRRDSFKKNTQAMKGRKRYSGKPYYSHCASAAYLASLFVAPDDEFFDISLDRILSHELVDVTSRYDPAQFKKIRKKFGRAYKDETNSSILLTGPDMISFYEVGLGGLLPTKVAGIIQVKEFGDRGHAIACVFDKLDSLLDQEFQKDRSERERIYSISKSFVAYNLFAVNELRDKVPDLVKPVEEICEATIKLYNIPKTKVEDHLKEYENLMRDYKDSIIKVIKKHLSRFGYKTPEGKTI